MEPEKSHDPQEPQGPQPFISKEERPDLTIDLNKKVGDLTVQDLQTLLGGGGGVAKLKELAKEKEDAIDKAAAKEAGKEQKDRKDFKDHKDPKEHKDQKDQKDQKDPKDPKDQKDQKDTKDTKDHKDPKDTKDHKDPKDPKEHKDNKDHKEQKDHKDFKDRKDIKEGLIEKLPIKDTSEKLPESKDPGEGPPDSGTTAGTTGLEDLIRRLSGLEREVQDLKGSGRGPGG